MKNKIKWKNDKTKQEFLVMQSQAAEQEKKYHKAMKEYPEMEKEAWRLTAEEKIWD